MAFHNNDTAHSQAILATFDIAFQPISLVALGKNLYGKFQFGYSYSGSEEERISDINWAFNDDEIDAIWAARGGYGCQHLIKNIKSKKFLENPKWYIGYSDNTVIHSYLLKHLLLEFLIRVMMKFLK